MKDTEELKNQIKNKKVLVVSGCNFSFPLNSGPTLRSMFNKFEKDNLAQMYFAGDNMPDFEFCSNYFKVTWVDILTSLVQGYSDCGSVYANTDDFDSNGTVESRSILSFLIQRFLYSIIPIFQKSPRLRDFIWRFNSWKSPKMLKWLDEYKPDLIFFSPADRGSSHQIARFISNYTRAPLVVWVTDDYVLFPKRINLIDKIQKIRLRRIFRKTISMSSVCFAIGDRMAKDYEKFFGKRFMTIMNSVKIQDYVEYSGGQNLNFSYFGSLYLDRWKILIKLAEAAPPGSISVYTDLSKLPKNIVEDIVFEFEKADIKIKEFVKGEDLRKAMLDSDILIQAESDDIVTKSLTRLSVATKIPEYLISGRAILGIGPPEVASMKLLSENNIGLVISGDNISIQNKNLKRIVDDPDYRKELGKRGYDYAVANFDNDLISARFKDIIENI